MSKTRSILKRYSLLREYNVLSNVKVNVAGQEHIFDELMIGHFGILCLTTFKGKGELFGNEADEHFITLYKNKTERKEVPNLIKKSLKDEEVLRKILSDNKIYSIKVEKGIVAEHRLCLPMIPSDKVPVFTPETLKKHLNCGKYDIDYKINVGAILSAIENAK